MLYYPHINPVAFHIGPIQVHWYGLLYLFSFAAGWLLIRYRAKKFHYGWKSEQIADLIFYCALGVILGGRLGYVLFYNLPFYFQNPLNIVKIWDGGMSFHGGMIGVFIAIWVWSLRYKVAYFTVTDLIAPVVPIGLAAGRLGNFINAELIGRITNLPWGMIYPNTDGLAHHPSELYEFLLEGVALFIILWFYSAKRPPRMAVSGAFLIGYAVFRIFCEFFRTPDPQLGFVAFGWLTMGQLLCIPMFILGVILLFIAYRGKRHATIS